MIRARSFRVPSLLFQRSAKKGGNRVRIQPIRRCHPARAASVQPWNIWIFVLAMCSLLSSTPARAQLWEVPPLPPVKYAQSQDGITATVGKENLHISVCRPGVVHFVAAPDPLNRVKPNQPWMLDATDSCPGAKFELTQGTDTVLLTTDVLKVELSLVWVSTGHGSGGGPVTNPDITVEYTGKAISVQAP
jgi:hypothetical protein